VEAEIHFCEGDFEGEGMGGKLNKILEFYIHKFFIQNEWNINFSVHLIYFIAFVQELPD